jgi:hypothetical protein
LPVPLGLRLEDSFGATKRFNVSSSRCSGSCYLLIYVKMGIPEGEDISISLLEHVSPIEWENVILYGQYVLNPDDIH